MIRRDMVSEALLIDCMEFMRTLPDKFFDLAIVDPPYGIGVAKMAYTQEEGRACKQKNGTRLVVSKDPYKYGKWDTAPPTKEYFDELGRISKHQIVWGINYMPVILGVGRIVWNKLNGNNSFSDAEIAYTSQHERVRLFNFMWSGMCQAVTVENGTVQQGNKALNESRIHPTQKPVALYKWLLTNYAKPRQKIFDSHMGSQSSRIAAAQLGFDYWGCELDPDYYRDGCKRFDAVIHRKDTTEYVPVEQTGVGQARLF